MKLIIGVSDFPDAPTASLLAPKLKQTLRHIFVAEILILASALNNITMQSLPDKSLSATFKNLSLFFEI